MIKNLTKDLLYNLYLEHKSLRSVSKILNIAPDTVKKYMNNFGLYFTPKASYSCDHNFFKNDNEKTFYIAGFIAADGCIKSRRPELFIGLSRNDRKHLELINNTLKSTYPIKDFLIKNSKRKASWNDTWSSQLSINSKQICLDLQKFNIVPRKTSIYEFPKWLIHHDLVHHFIRGYFDGDGSFYFNGNTKCFSLRGTYNCLDNIRKILEIKCNLPKNEKSIRISSNHPILEYTGNNIINIVYFLYKDATIYLNRKYNKIYNQV